MICGGKEMKKKLIGAILIVMVLLLGVSQIHKPKGKGIAIAKSQFETQIIKLYVDGKNEVIQITEPDEVQAILTIVNRVDEFRIVLEEEVTTGVCQKWLVFDTGVTIGIHANSDYGNVESDIQEVGTPLYLPQGLCDCVNEIMEKHSANEHL